MVLYGVLAVHWMNKKNRLELSWEGVSIKKDRKNPWKRGIVCLLAPIHGPGPAPTCLPHRDGNNSRHPQSLLCLSFVHFPSFSSLNLIYPRFSPALPLFSEPLNLTLTLSIMILLGKQLKIVLIGDARVGKVRSHVLSCRKMADDRFCSQAGYHNS